MNKRINSLGITASLLTLVIVGGASVLALPPQARAHAQATGNPGYGSAPSQAVNNGSVTPNYSAASHPGSAQAVNGQAHLQTAQLKACQNRENAINTIISRIDTRAQNQLNLFTTIASRVENFYTQTGKNLKNYSQLLAAVNSAKAQAEADFSTLKSSSTFSCTLSNPKGMVTAFQGILKTEIKDLQNYRTAVKNLIVGVASVNGVTVSASNNSSANTGSN